MDITKGSIWTSIAELNGAKVERYLGEFDPVHGVQSWEYQVKKANGDRATFTGNSKEVRGLVMWFLVFGSIYVPKE